MTDLEKRVRAVVEQVPDPETGLTFGQMDMITEVKETGPGIVSIDFIPSSPFCPIAFKLAMDIKNAALTVQGVKKASIYCKGHTMEEQINQMINK